MSQLSENVLCQIFKWSRLPHNSYTLLLGSVAQQIERVSAASAVPPPTTLFSYFEKELESIPDLYLDCLSDVCILYTKRNVVVYNSHGCRFDSDLSQLVKQVLVT